MTRVYILGAGASAGYRNGKLRIAPPTARKFFGAVAKLLAANHGLDRYCFDALWKYLEKYYDIGVENLADCRVDIEEVLTLIDIGKAESEVRQQLLRLIFLTLEKVIYGNPCEHHRRLIQSLGPEDAIITFNWDLLVDNVIALENGGVVNYGTDRLELVGNATPPAKAPNGAPLLLKLHGSMNWMTCPECKKSFAYPLQGKPAARYYADRPIQCRYPDCPGFTEPFMIPPTLIKNYDHPVIEAVWLEAAKILGRADEIVIVGYSLPPTDFKAKWLFMDNSAGRSAQCRSLTIIDKHPTRSLNDRLGRAFHAADGTFRIIKGGIKDIPI